MPWTIKPGRSGTQFSVVFRRRSKGGIGSNQYQIRGESQRQPGSISPEVEGPSLVGQVEPKRSMAERRRCGEVWGSICNRWVESPGYSHGAHPGVHSKEIVASMSDTPVEMLEILAQDPVSTVRSRVANNYNTPSTTLERLSADPVGKVRYMTATNHNTPPDVLRQLTYDVVPQVRVAVARSRFTPPDSLERLALDIDVNVQMGVANNPKTPTSVLARLAVNPDKEVATLAMANPALPSYVRDLAGVVDQQHKI